MHKPEMKSEKWDVGAVTLSLSTRKNNGRFSWHKLVRKQNYIQATLPINWATKGAVN